MQGLKWFFAALVFGFVAWLLIPVLEPYAMRWWSSNQALQIQESSAQIRNSVQLHKLQRHSDVEARVSPVALQEAGFLRKTPRNPVLHRGGGPYQLLHSGDVRARGVPADVLVLDLGQNRLLCERLNDSLGEVGAVHELSSLWGPNIRPVLTERAGCFRVSERFPWGALRPSTYVYYAQL